MAPADPFVAPTADTLPVAEAVIGGRFPEPIAPGGEPRPTGGGQLRQIARTFIENKLAVAGFVVLVLMVLFCWVGPLFYHTNQTNTQTALLNSTQNAPPSGTNPLGTDENGFDILGRLMFGGQNSLMIGFAAAGVATVLGVIWGAVSGFFGGVVDSVMMRIVDVFLSIPYIFLLVTLTVIFQSSVGLLIIVIGAVAWLVPARLVRGETLTLRVREYVQAVRVMGGKGRRVVFRHIIPNTVGTIVVNATFQVADAILALAALGFLGLGVPPPQTDWGSMLSDGVNVVTLGYWWEIYPVAIAIILVVVSLNFIGDALRDAFEVRLQRR
ncbi:MAG: ABC transporter permease [Actinomycetota bacterium]|nr:ABC transporter permease [Actinomycetota bacterium]